MTSPRIFLSVPHMSGLEQEYIAEAFRSNWIAPLGPHVDAFETEFAKKVGSPHAAALSSGTAALHLSLILLGVGRGDEVFCSDLTFAASANAILYQGAAPVFIDSDRKTWNMDPNLLEEELKQCDNKGKLPKAVILVHLYGQGSDIDPVLDLCNKYEIPLVEDAAESLGATYKGRSPGTFGNFGIFSFNGNKIITTSGGGMLVSGDEAMIAKARFLATQARDDTPDYQHSHVGYNYRLSNILAGIGRAQLKILEERVNQRRRNFEYYQNVMEEVAGIEFMPEATYGRSTRWLTCILVDPEKFGASPEDIRLHLDKNNIEARPVWKPMHMQPLFKEYRCCGGDVSEDLFARGLCLPSGSNLADSELQRVAEAVISTPRKYNICCR
jgi:dTDP-4-amino-4,6-dideoxygalactose transaminase